MYNTLLYSVLGITFMILMIRSLRKSPYQSVLKFVVLHTLLGGLFSLISNWTLDEITFWDSIFSWFFGVAVFSIVGIIAIMNYHVDAKANKPDLIEKTKMLSRNDLFLLALLFVAPFVTVFILAVKSGYHG